MNKIMNETIQNNQNECRDKWTASKKIRHKILNMSTPFCMMDLYKRVNPNKEYDDKLVTWVFNELYDEGLIKYEKLFDDAKGNFVYAFYVIDIYDDEPHILANKLITK